MDLELNHDCKVWSPGQTKFLEAIRKGLTIADSNDAYSSTGMSPRRLFACGEPGAGKTEAVIGAAIAAAKNGAKVFIGARRGLW